MRLSVNIFPSLVYRIERLFLFYSFISLLMFLVIIISPSMSSASCVSDTIVAECNNGVCTEGFKEIQFGDFINATDRDLNAITKVLSSEKRNTSGVFAYEDIDKKACGFQSMLRKLEFDTVKDAREISEMRAMLPSRGTIFYLSALMFAIMTPIYFVLLIIIQRRETYSFLEKDNERQDTKPSSKAAYGIIITLILMLFMMFFLPPSSHRYMCAAPPKIIISECSDNKCTEGFKVTEGAFYCEYTNIVQATKEELDATEITVRDKYNYVSGIYESTIELPMRFRFVSNKSSHENQISFKKLEIKTLDAAKERWKSNIRAVFLFEYIFSIAKMIIFVVIPFLLATLFIISRKRSKENVTSKDSQQFKAIKIQLFVLVYSVIMAYVFGGFILMILPFSLIFISLIIVYVIKVTTRETIKE